MRYDHGLIEAKWQKRWLEDRTFAVENDERGERVYVLDMFPYPSADGLHVGHPEGYTASDIVARWLRMNGKQVLHPMGWDAFGLPAENFAIKKGVHPRIVTEQNIVNFKRQIQSIGFSYDWNREINTTDPAYYKWTQWIFLQLYKRGLAYEKEAPIWWCPKDKTGLANEEVVNGCCERCGTKVEKKMLKQWMLKITEYADRLISGLDGLDWPESIKALQRNWIGRSEGALITFKLHGISGQADDKHSVQVFTTRPDTIFGATFLVVSPELAQTWLNIGWKAEAKVKKYIQSALSKTEIDRQDTKKAKTGIDAKITAVNPATKEEIPVWVADYVLGGYGTGAIMAVPAHDERDFEFAKKFKLPIRKVIKPPSVMPQPMAASAGVLGVIPTDLESECWVGEGTMMNSGKFDGLPSDGGREKIVAWLQSEKMAKPKVQYKLRDWVFSRQRYWGEPIPLVHCPKDGVVPVPEDQLPVVLPAVERYQPTGTGESPLANVKDWVNTTCPKCGGPAKRETNTMPQWAGSCWYYLRFTDPSNDKELASTKALKAWLPVDIYVGGAEHAVLHLLYSRFWHKVLFDVGALPKEIGDEPFMKLKNQGLILGPDGEKMSKSRGNVINPDDIIEKYGADTLRMYEMFMGPFEDTKPWSSESIIGVRRFLERVWRAFDQVDPAIKLEPDYGKRLLNQFIKFFTEDIENFKFNTCVSGFMEWSNRWGTSKIPQEEFESFLKLLAPFAPHITEELWQKLGHESFIAKETWPKFDPKLVKAISTTIVVQVNGKLRASIHGLPMGLSEEEVVKKAVQIPQVKKFLAIPPKKTIYVKDKLINFVV